MLISQIIIFAVSFLVLAWASKVLISSLTKISQFLQVSEYALAFIVMGIATSVPELFLSISSSFQGIGHLSLGNVIGANILNITLVVGLVALLAGGIKSGPETHSKIAPIFIIVILPLLLLYDGLLDWIDGSLLIIVYFWYLSGLLKTKKVLEETKESLISPEDSRPDIQENIAIEGKLQGRIKDIFVFLGAMIILLASSFFIINAAQSIALSMNLGLVTFGIFIVALGTTVPELVFGVRSVMLKHDEMTIGNVLGSLAVNSTLVLGIASIISPINISLGRELVIPAAFLIVALIIFRFVLRDGVIAVTKKEGFFLVILYGLFVLLNSFT